MAEPVVQYTLNLILAAWGGVSVVLCGLAGWLGAVVAGRIARRESQAQAKELELLKAELSSTNEALKAKRGAHWETVVWVDKVRFEHEYRLYQDIWTLLQPMCASAFRLRPTVRLSSPARPQKEAWVEAEAAFLRAANAYRPYIEKCEPFLPPAVFAALMEVYFACSGEHLDAAHPDSEETAEERNMARRKLDALIQDAALAIRTRLDEVRVR
jgi:hypothetical protein